MKVVDRYIQQAVCFAYLHAESTNSQASSTPNCSPPRRCGGCQICTAHLCCRGIPAVRQGKAQPQMQQPPLECNPQIMRA